MKEGLQRAWLGSPLACNADVVTGREHAGRPIGVPDAQIAAICRELGAVLATRNVKDFEETGVELVDPWEADA